MKTNMKHTSGQWHTGTGNGARWEDEEDEANARLIAAAPELLQAFKDLFRECAMVQKYWGDSANTKEADAAIKRAKDAIAKVTGQD